MSIKELTAIVPPPAKPLEANNATRWSKLEEDLGIHLPDDLREFGLRYGTGEFCGGLMQVYNPFSRVYREIIDFELSYLRQLKSSSIGLPYDVFPSTPGLYPWGRDENGHTMLWLTQGNPDQWPVILKSHEDEFESWQMSMTTFLAKALSNSIHTLLWQEPFTKDQQSFEPRADG